MVTNPEKTSATCAEDREWLRLATSCSAPARCWTPPGCGTVAEACRGRGETCTPTSRVSTGDSEIPLWSAATIAVSRCWTGNARPGS